MRIRNIIKIEIFAIALSIGISSCGGGDDPINDVTPTPKTVKVESVSLSKTTLSIEEGGEQTITVTISPSNATNKKYTLTSSDSNILTVDENGKVKAIKSGEATITVTTTDGNKTASCKVTVTPKVIPAEKINLEKSELSLEEGSEVTITYTLTPENATDTSVTWSSSDSTVVAVDENGKLTAVMEGEAIVTAATADGSKTATCKVMVTPKVILVEKINLGKAELSLEEGSEENITYTITPENATDTSITWSSSDPNIVVIDENGRLIAVKEGVATITATTADGSKTATCKVTVTPKVIPVEKIEFEKEVVTLMEGREVNITYSLTPNNATTSVTWSSSNPSIVVVDENGKLTAVKEGNATITATTANGNITTSCSVTVTPKEEVIEFADAEVKALCIANLDTNHDGELSIREAADVTFLGYIFRGEKIQSFNEFQYFTGLTAIDDAFRNCIHLTSITIPSSMKIIGSRSFEGCKNLTSITIPSSVTKIDGFNGSGLTSITIPSSVTEIEDGAFGGCKNLTSITIPNSVTKIGEYAFNGCTSLTSITIPNSVTKIGEYAFNGCEKLTSVTLQDGLTTIGTHTFSNCTSLTSITIPSSVKAIGDYAFSCTNISNVVIHDGVEIIGNYTFYDCDNLTSITIPSSVTHIQTYAFRGCDNLTITLLSAYPPELGTTPFDNTSKNKTLIFVPAEAVDIYKNDADWKNYAENIKAIQ